MNIRSYVLVTACRNESLFIRELIATIAKQSVRPKKWVIIDDNSSDSTFELAQAAGQPYDFIDVRRANSNRSRSFSSQVYAQQEGYEVLRPESFEFVGFLDADIQLPSDYYQNILSRFLADASLAIAGGLVVDKQGGTTSSHRLKSADHHVAGGVQLFRRPCYDEINGYAPIEGGGQDTVAETMCMMRGWKVRSFADMVAYHLRPSEGDARTHFRAGVRWGHMCYNLGYHPFFYGANTLMRFFGRPSIRLASGQIYGFFQASLRGKARPVSPEFVKFVRQRQLQKLWKSLWPARSQPDSPAPAECPKGAGPV
ncbi:MAG: glycosyltransferase family A protein [Opitutaceae bacterium]|jgi:glycosyltransferase involved in cell wall biosynthesis